MFIRIGSVILAGLACLPSVAVGQSNYSWNGTTGSFGDSGKWSLGATTPAGPPGTADRATFFPGGTFTVAGSGSVAQVVIQVTDVTFTGTIAAAGGFSGFVNGVEVGATGFGKATFTGAGAALNVSAPIAVGSGSNGVGVLAFKNGAVGSSVGTSVNAAVVLSGAFLGSGTMLIENPGSSFTTTGSFVLGGRNSGEVTVTDEGELHTNGSVPLNVAGLNIGGGDSLAVNAQGTLNITNNGVVHNELQTNLGLYGKGTINISGGSFTSTNGNTVNPAISIARFAGSEGHLNVSGTGHVITEGASIGGGAGRGDMPITDQGLVESAVTVGAPAIVGFASTADGFAVVDGAAARWEVTDALVVGQQGDGRLELLNGGTLFVEDTLLGGDPYLHIGDAQNSNGTVLVSDEFSFLDASFIPTTIGWLTGSSGRLEITDLGEAFLQQTVIGHEGVGDLYVHDGGVLTTGTAVLGRLENGSGSVTLESGATWEVLGQLLVGSDGGGDLWVDADTTLTVDEFIEVGRGANSFGTLTIVAATSLVNGNFSSVSIGAAGEGELYLENDASWSVVGDANLGLVSGGRGTAFVAPSASWHMTGGLFVGGFDTAAGGVGKLEIQGAVAADTRVKIWDDGVAELVNGGTLASPLVEIHGQIIGNGTVDSDNVINDGLVSPSRSLNFHTARLTFTGDYEQTANGVLEIQIGGDVPLFEFDQIVIGGTAILQGQLHVSLIDIGLGPFMPVLNDEFTILTASAFDPGQPEYDPSDVTLPTLASGLTWEMVYTNSELILKVISGTGVPGDYNGDGIVNAADYTVWRDTLGAPTETSLQGNGDGLNGVDVGDYTHWETNFGMTNSAAASRGSSQAVPEPSAFLLLVGVMAFCLAARRDHCIG